MNRSPALFALLFALLLGALVLSQCRPPAAPLSQSSVSDGGDYTNADGAQPLLQASGTIRADSFQVASELGGRLQQVYVRVGDEVLAREELATFDSAPLLSKLTEAEAAVSSARADLELAAAPPRPAEVDAARASLLLASAQADGAYAAWQDAEAMLEDPQELDAQIAEARTKVALAEQGVELAEAQLARQQLLRDQTPADSLERQIADLQVQASTENLASAEADLSTAETALSTLWSIRSQPLALIAQRNGARGQYQLAQAQVAVEWARYQDVLDGPTPAEIAVAQAALDLAEAKAGAIRAQLDRFTLTSPRDGLVLEQIFQAGEVVAPAAAVLTIADLSQVTLVVYVPANDIDRVALDQEVQVFVDSLPDRAFSGTVTHIGDSPEFTPRNVATEEERVNTFFEVEVTLPNPDHLLKPGMPADARFH